MNNRLKETLDLIGQIPSKMRPEFEKVAHGWANIEESQRRRHFNTIKICLFSPFLFGKSYVPNNWLDWMQHAGFLTSAKRLEVKCYDDPYFFAMDTLDKTFEALHNMMEKPIFFFSVMSVVEEIDTLAKKPEDCIRIGKAESTFCDFFNDEGDTFEKKMALLYSAKSYIEYVNYVVKLGKNRFKDIAPATHLQKRVQSYKSKGNSKFQDGHFTKAILLYSKALQLDPYNHFLYGNRAQTYLKTDKFQEALWDSRRALVLEPNWAKGCYRYAQAFFELHFLDRALQENYSGFAFADEPNEKRDLLMQMKKFYDCKNELGRKPKIDEDDVPDLVDQGGSSDEGNDDSSDSEAMPDLVSDGLESFSDDASDSEFMEPTQRRLIGLRKKRAQRQRKEIGERRKREEIKLKAKKDKPAVIRLLSSFPGSSAKLKTVPKTESKSETTLKPEPTPVKTSHDEMKKELTNGSESHLDKKERDALMQYQKAVKLMNESPVKYGGMNEDEYVGFTYCYAHICLSSGIPEEIQKSEQLFAGILKDFARIYFPLAYYGLGCYYQRLNRFSEAVEQLKKGEKSLNESPESQPVIFWPGTSQPVKESVSEYILESFEDLHHDCKNPPKPLAVCHVKECTYFKREIYLTDMDFKGYVHIVCTEDCRLDYHIGCWKHCKVDFYDRTHEKDILSKACSTPDCLGTIFTISTYGNDGCVRSEAKVDPNSKAKHPLKPAQQSQLTKSKKKRQKKKQKKNSELETAATSTETTNEVSQTKSKESKPKKEAHTTPVVETILNEKDEASEKKEEEEEEDEDEEKKQDILEKQVDYEFVLKKDDIEDNQLTNQKVVKKKKQKSKKALSDFEFKFSGDEKRRFWGHEDADENGYIDFKKYMLPSVDKDESSVASAVAGSEDAQSISLDDVENIDEIVFMLYSFFHAVLEKEGPLPITDSILVDDFKSFPPEAHTIVKAAGGLAQFLLKSLKFAMFEDHICLLKHAVRCKEILAIKHGHAVDTDLEPSGAPYYHSQEQPLKDFQPLLTPFEFQNLKEKLVKSSYKTVDGVDEIKINDLGSDEDKISEISDEYSTASETDPNGGLDEEESSSSQESKSEENKKESFNDHDGYQVDKNDSCVQRVEVSGSPRKESLMVDFEEYIDDDILGKELELERYMMEVPSDNVPTLNEDLAKEIQTIPDSHDALNEESSKHSPVQPSDYSLKKGDETIDSGVGTVSPDDITPTSIEPSLKSEDGKINSKFSSGSSSILPPEILEGFCLNKPTPYGPITPEKPEPYSVCPSWNGTEENLDKAERFLVQEKMWDQGLDLLTSLDANLDWFTLEKPPGFNRFGGAMVLIRVCLWDATVASIVKVRDHCTELQKTKLHMKSKFVQCTPKTKNVCLNTIPYEPYKQDYLEMKAKKDQLQESLEDTMTKYVHLKQNSVVESSRLREELNKMKRQNEELLIKLNEKLTHAEQDQKKWQTERSCYVLEGKAKDAKLQTLDDDLVKMTTDMSVKTHQVNQLTQHIHQERDHFSTEKNKFKEAIELSNRSCQVIKNRAEESEVRLLKLMCANQCKTLMDVIKEAETNRIKLMSSDHHGDKLVMHTIQTWQATVSVNTKKVQEVKSNYDGLMQKVKSGTALEMLSPVADVSPYWPPPDSVKPSKKAVSSGFDANKAGNPQVHPNTAATSTAAPSKPASQKNTWLSAQQNEAKRRESSHMASNSHQTNTMQNYEWNQGNSQQQQPHSSQNNGMPHMVGTFTQNRQMPAQAYRGNPHGMAQGGPQGGHYGLPQDGMYRTNSTASHSVLQQPTAPTTAAASSNSLENKKHPAAVFENAAKPAVVPENSQANPLKQTHSLGTVRGSRVGPIPTAPAHLKNSFDKLIYQLGVIFDNQYTKGQLAMFLKEVREANGGSLSGLPSKDIIDRVVKMVLKREQEHPVSQPAKVYPKKLPPGISTASEPGLSTWKTIPVRQIKPLNLEEEDPCVICHEEMPLKPVSKLECQHIFHTDCIQRWMNEQKTCPTCREFVLLPDEYPTL